MKIRSFFLALPILFLLGCELVDFGLDNDIPKCVRKKIRDFDGEVGFQCESGASVSKFLFNEREVYVFEPGNCGADMSSPVFDADCNELGSLGGFAGNLEIDGMIFHENAVLIERVWED